MQRFFLAFCVRWALVVITLATSSWCCNGEKSMHPAGHLQPLGSHRPAEGDVEVVDEVPHPVEFYERYVKTGKPLLFRGGTSNSRAFQYWSDAYLAEKFGSLVMMTEHGKKEDRTKGTSYVQLKTFLSRYNGSDEYMVETLPPKMHDDFQLLRCLLCGGFTSNLRDAVMWFSSGGTKSVLHNDGVDNINCLMSGSKDLFMVDKKYADMVHIDVAQGSYSSVDVDSVDVHKYPGLGKVPWWKAHMEAGDCLYIPYKWYHQVRSYGRNLAINIWWVPITRFNESMCFEEKDGENIRKPLSQYASLSLYGFSPGEYHRHTLLDEVLNAPDADKQGISRRTLTELAEEMVSSEEEVTNEPRKGWKKAVKKIFEVSDVNNDRYLERDEILQIPSSLLVAAMGNAAEGPDQSKAEVADNYAREHGLTPDELDTGSLEGDTQEEGSEDNPEDEFNPLESDELQFEENPASHTEL